MNQAAPLPGPDALFRLAQAACRLGELERGIGLAREALAAKPNHGRAHNLIGLALSRLGRPLEALVSFDAAIAADPALADAHGNRADVLAELGRTGEAMASYDRALALDPDSAENWCNRGAALRDLRRYEEALASYDHALALEPTQAHAHINRGNALSALARHEEALTAYGHALALEPGHAHALTGRGAVLHALKRYPEALADFDLAVSLAPRSVDARMRRGIALIELKRPADALAEFEALLAFDPHNADALNNRGFVLNALDRGEEALESCDAALRIDPGYVEALTNRGVALTHLGRDADALASYDRALALAPRHLGALCNRARSLSALHRNAEALATAQQALAVEPAHADALFTCGNSLVKLGRHAEALAYFERVRAIDPGHRYALGAAVNCCLWTCDWQGTARLAGELREQAADGRAIVSPLTLFGLPMGAAELLVCTRRYVADEMPTRPIPLPPPVRARAQKIRLGYLSGDFRQHPVAHLISELFERHDRERFEVIGFSCGRDDGSVERARIMRGVDRFLDVRSQGDRAAAVLMREHEIDVAIDLGGHTDNSRTPILRFRPAPVQVNYLGYAGTLATDFIDYVIADRIVLPFDQQPHWSENIVHLPDSFLVNDATKAIAARTPSRAEAGLPPEGFVFCCFNNSYKLSPPVFAVWMRLLRAVEGSVLWLSQPNERAAANLRAAAAAHEIAPERLIFAPRVAAAADHFARHRLADLFIDTLPYNAHTTASDALWAGLPIVTCVGETFAGRVGASLLHAVGLPELVTENLDAYEALALKFAREPTLLRSIRKKLAHNRLRLPLFDSDRFRRHIEAAYAAMWERWLRGEPPQSFAVAPIGN